MDNVSYSRPRQQRDFRRESRQARRRRRSERLQKQYNFKGIWGTVGLVLICMAACVALWFAANLLIQMFVYVSNVNLKVVD